MVIFKLFCSKLYLSFFHGSDTQKQSNVPMDSEGTKYLEYSVKYLEYSVELKEKVIFLKIKRKYVHCRKSRK